ncbi:MAG TPA: hypothetical protein VGY55_04380 [Pirellulales bacterium]|nr:hypothetical protein [Pirellulales bacterium]
MVRSLGCGPLREKSDSDSASGLCGAPRNVTKLDCAQPQVSNSACNNAAVAGNRIEPEMNENDRK